MKDAIRILLCLLGVFFPPTILATILAYILLYMVGLGITSGDANAINWWAIFAAAVCSGIGTSIGAFSLKLLFAPARVHTRANIAYCICVFALLYFLAPVAATIILLIGACRGDSLVC